MKKEEKESLTKLFNRLVNANLMLKNEETIYMPQRMRVAVYFAGKLCNKSKVKNNWFKSQKKIAEELGMREDNLSKYCKELSHLFHRDPRDGYKKRYWHLGPAPTDSPKVKVETKKRIEKVKEDIVITKEEEEELFNDSPDQIEIKSEKIKKGITIEEWRKRFLEDTSSFRDYTEPYLYFDKLLACANLDWYDQDNFDLGKAQGVSQGIKNLIGGSYSKDTIVSLCEAYVKEKVIDKPKYFKNLWITEFKKYIDKNYSGSCDYESNDNEKSYYDDIQQDCLKRHIAAQWENIGA
jgi:hypothetical protein